VVCFLSLQVSAPQVPSVGSRSLHAALPAPFGNFTRQWLLGAVTARQRGWTEPDGASNGGEKGLT